MSLHVFHVPPRKVLQLIAGRRPEGSDRVRKSTTLDTRSIMSDTMASPPAIEDQGRLLEDALAQVRQQTHLMRRCLENPGKLMDALKCRYESPWVVCKLTAKFR